MAIENGSTMPDGELTIVTDDGPKKVSTSEFFAGRKVVMFAVPGAFTPTCHNTHMPPFVARAQEFRDKGVDEIAVISVNDPFVMSEWRKSSNAMGQVTFIADGNADYTKALGMEIDASGGGLGTRSKRYAMLVDDGEVKHFTAEENPGEVSGSGADVMLAKL